jgi:hypothetical protein
MIPGGADASVSIKVDVDDAGAQARIAALEARLKALEKQFGGTGKGADDYGKKLDNVSKKAGNSDKSHKDLMKSGDALGKMFGKVGKFAKFAGIEFLALTAGLGAMKLALWAGQTAMKGFQALLRGMGAAAGVAVGAIATVLAALREVQAVKLAPILGGVGNAKTQSNAFFADRRFAMFDQKTMASIMQSAAEQGQIIDASFRNQLAGLANYSLGDPKKLASIQKVFQQVQKDGKVTAKTYAELQTASPALAKAFDEMAGGTKKGEAAAKAGSVTYKKFFDTVQEGKLKALEPFQGALGNINDTLMARFKGSVMGVKEQLTRMGEPLLEGFKKPLTMVEREISLFILKINGTVGKVFPTLFDVKDTNNNFITKMFDKLANSVNTNMGKISGWVTSLKGWVGSIRGFFGGTGDMLRKFSTGWDKLYNKILKPIGMEVIKTLGHLFNEFNKTIDSQPLGSFETAIGNIGEVIRNLITGFAELKKIMAPVLSAFLNMAGAISGITKIPGLKLLLPLLLMGKFMGGGRGGRGRGGAGGAGGGGMGAMGMGASMMMSGGMGPGMGVMNMLTMPLMMGMSGFGMNTKYGAASSGNYAANRAAGAGRLPSLALSSNLGYGFASNMRGGMGLGASALLSGSGSRSAMANGFTNRKGQAVQGSVAATQQARIDAIMGNRAQRASLLGKTAAGMSPHAYLQSKGFVFDPVQQGYRNSATGQDFTNDEAMAHAKAEQGKVAKGTIATRRASNAKVIQQGKLQAIATGKAQGQAAGKAFVKDAGAKFGKAAGAMAATVGATMLGGYITQKAGTNKGMAAAGGALSGAGMGASMGAAFGPWGMLAGAVGGGIFGAISGWRNSEKLRAQNTATSIQNVQGQITGGKLFNQQSDFDLARTDAATVYKEIGQLSDFSGSGIKAQIEEKKALKEANDFGIVFMGELPAMVQGLVDRVAKAGYSPLTETYNTDYDEFGNAITKNRLTGFVNKDGEQFDMERNDIENIGKEYAASLQYSTEAIDKAFGDGRDTLGALEYLSNLNYESDIKGLEADLKALEEKYPDVGAASQAYKEELEKITQKQADFSTISGKVAGVLDGTGVSMNEVTTLFEKLGLSLSETGVGIKEFNTLIGMTGDFAADRANGAGRLGRSLLAQSQLDLKLQESRSRLEQQLETFFSTRGSQSALDATTVSSGTLNEIVANAVAALAAGKTNWTDLVGTQGQNGEPGAPGQLQNQLYETLLQGYADGVSPDVMALLSSAILGSPATATTPAVPGMLSDLETAKSDPFARAQFDAGFNQAFTNMMTGAANDIAASVTPETTEEEIRVLLDTKADAIENFLKSNGMEITPEAREKIETMLQSTFLNSSTAMADALYKGGTFVAAAIRSALTDPKGTPLVPGAGGSTEEPVDSKKDTGDTTTSRFARTMSSHNRLNAMVPGKRMVTSGLRNTNLGSMGSDHATGAAYDLVGDNLVSYANNVKTAGGFAEFHGDTANKHLHVVPPAGDTSSPRSVGYDSSGSGGSTNNYNFQIHGDGADPQEIANAVMDRIARAERNRRERS